MKEKNVRVPFEESLHNELRWLARRKHLPMTSVIRTLVKAAVDEEKRQLMQLSSTATLDLQNSNAAVS